MLQYLFSKAVFLSIAGGVIVLLISLAGHMTQKILSSRWNYYIWLFAVSAFLLPVSYTPFSGMPPALVQTEGEAQPRLEQKENASNNTIVQGETAPEPNAAHVGSADRSAVTTVGSADGVSARFSYSALWTGLGTLLPYMWLAGVFILMILKLVQRIRFLSTMKKLAVPPVDIQFAVMQQTAVETGVKRQVQLRCFCADDSPFVVGIFRPVIYIPASLQDTEELGLALRHELIHCARWDLLYKTVVELIAVIHFFNPMVYYMQKKIDENCEYSCDERVIRRLDVIERKKYGLMLLSRAKTGRRKMGGSAALFEQKKALSKRVELIVKTRQVQKWTVMVSMILLLAMSVSCFSLAGIVNAQNTVNPPRMGYVTNEISFAKYYCEDHVIPGSLVPITQYRNEGTATYTTFAGYTTFSAAFFAMNAEGQAKLDDKALSPDQQFAVFDNPAYYTDYYQIILNKVMRKYGEGYGLEGAFTLTRNGEAVFENQTGHLTALPPKKERTAMERTELTVPFIQEGKEVIFSLELNLEEPNSALISKNRMREAELERSLETQEVYLGRLVSSSMDGHPLDFQGHNERLKQAVANEKYWENSDGYVRNNPTIQDAEVQLAIATHTYVRLYEVDICTDDTLTGKFIVMDDGTETDIFTGTVSGLSHPVGETLTLRSKDGRYQAEWEIVPFVQRPLSVYGTRDPQEFYTDGEDVFIGTPYEQDQFDRNEHDRLYKRIVVDENGKVLLLVSIAQQQPDALSNLEDQLKGSSYSIATSWQNLFRGGKVLTAEGEAQKNILVLQDPGTWWYRAVIQPENQYFEERAE